MTSSHHDVNGRRDLSTRLRFFFSQEEARVHVHVSGPDGHAKVWMDPTIEIAHNYGLRDTAVGIALVLIGEREHEIRSAWDRHFWR